MELLVLFDVDGTLLISDDPLVGQATCAAIESVYGVRIADDAMSRIDHPGRTSSWIMRQLLRNEGVGDDEVARGLARRCDAVSASYLELFAKADPTRWKAPPGTAEALRRIEAFARVALLTGNPEPIARARMGRLGLGAFFPAGQGAFGCDAVERTDLIALARRRAGDWPRNRTVEVGDTPRDVSGSKAAGVLSVAVLWGRFGRDELAGADAMVTSMDELPGVLQHLADGPG